MKEKLVSNYALLDEPEFASAAWLVIELCWKYDGNVCLAWSEALHIVDYEK